MSGSAIPCLGFPSKSQAAFWMKASGMTHREIAERLGININSVGGLLANARIYRRGTRPARFSHFQTGEAAMMDDASKRRRLAAVARLRMTAKELRGRINNGHCKERSEQYRNAAAGMDHLADLLTHHGHQGGYPNVRIAPENIPARRFYAPVDRHSWTGSTAAACADGHAYV